MTWIRYELFLTYQNLSACIVHPPCCVDSVPDDLIWIIPAKMVELKQLSLNYIETVCCYGLAFTDVPYTMIILETTQRTMELLVDDSPLGQYLKDTANMNNDHMSTGIGRKSIANKRDSAVSEVGSWSEQPKRSFAPQGRPVLSKHTTEPEEQEGPSLIQVIRTVSAVRVHYQSS